MSIFMLLFIFLLFNGVNCIIDGFPANRYDIRSQVSVITRFPAGFSQVCGGVLIAPSLVLTAAHCVHVNGKFATTARVSLGSVTFDGDDEEDQQFWSLAMVINNRFLKQFFDDPNNDVAIVFLPSEAKTCESATSVQIAKLLSTPNIHFETHPKVLSNFELVNSVCYIAGWGKTENKTETYSKTARQTMVSLTMKKVGGRNHLLAKGPGKLCMGDSGSPVYCFVDGQRTLVGTVAHMTSFSQREHTDRNDHVSFCRDFEYTFIADWRESSLRILEMLEENGDPEELEKGQQHCFGTR